MENELESAFSFKDLFFYYVKRWLVLLIITLSIAVGYFSVGLISRTSFSDSFQASAAFCSFESFLTKVSKDEGASYGSNPAIETIYNTIATRVISELNTNEVKNKFLNDTDAIQAFRSLYYQKNDPTRTTFDYEMNRNFTFTQKGVYFYVTIKGVFDTEIKQSNAKKLVDLYMGIAKASADTAELNYIEITQALPDYTGTAAVIQRSTVADIAIGLAIGLVAAVITVFALYYFDPRIKSYNAITSKSGILLSKSVTGAVDEKAARYAAVNMINAKSLFVCSFSGGAFGEEAARSVSRELSKCGLKVLHINFSDATGGSGIGEYLNGGEAGFTLKDGYSYCGAKEATDWFLLMNKKERFEALYKDFDKIVMYCSEAGDGSSAVIGGYADKLIYIIDQKKDRLKKAEKVLNMNTNADAVIGSFIHNPI